MATVSTDVLRRLRKSAYFLAVLLFVLPVGEIITTAWPFLLGQPVWRFSIGGMAGASSATMLVGLFFALSIAMVSEDRWAAILTAVAASVSAIVYLGGAALFFLDAVQLTSNFAAQDPLKYRVTASWILVKMALSGVAFVIVAVGAIRAVGAMRRSKLRTADAGPLIVGR